MYCRHGKTFFCNECQQEREKLDQELNDYIKHLPFHLPSFDL